MNALLALTFASAIGGKRKDGKDWSLRDFMFTSESEDAAQPSKASPPKTPPPRMSIEDQRQVFALLRMAYGGQH